MAMQLKMADITRFREEAERLKKRVAKATEHADKVIDVVVQSAEVNIAAFGTGLMIGRTGGVDFFNVPVELLGGVGLHLLAFLGVGGSKADHMHNFGNGLLAAYMGGVGRKLGQDWKTKSLPGSTAAGADPKALPDGGGRKLTDNELEKLIASR